MFNGLEAGLRGWDIAHMLTLILSDDFLKEPHPDHPGPGNAKYAENDEGFKYSEMQRHSA
jgi:hypothetical protein